MIRTIRRRFRRLCAPVQLGQTHAGFYLAAGLVALWLVTRPQHVEAARVTGSSEDQYLKIEWLYDLDEGYGIWLFSGKGDEPTQQRGRWITRLQTITVDVAFDEISGSAGDRIEGPDLIGAVGGRSIFSYSMNASNLSSGIILPFIGGPAVATVRFPTEGIRLVDSLVNFELETTQLNSAALPVMNYQSTLPFVSIEQIPEPATAASLLAAAAGTLALRRRED